VKVLGKVAAVCAGILLTACSQGEEAVPALVRGPQIALPSQSSIVVAWRTNIGTTGVVEYGETPALGSASAGLPRASEHVHTLSGLDPGTQYHYRILMDGAVVSEGHSFWTHPADPAAPFRFVVFGDSGSGAQPQLDVAAQVSVSDPDLVIHTGDVIYVDGAPSELDPHYFTPYRDLIDRIPFYLSFGNHDVRTQNGRPLKDAVYLPGNEKYYSFDFGDTHFIALDTNDSTAPGSAQYLWLEADLQATTATWIIVYFHHPPYSSSNHGSDLTVRAHLTPLFDQHGVDIAFSGHDHNYERTFPLRADQPDPQGVTYVVAGAGGAGRLYASGTSAFTATSESVYHHVQVDIDGSQATLTAIRSDGTVIETVNLTATP
jgi:hypothetical protein